MAKASLDQNQIRNLLRHDKKQSNKVPEWPLAEDRKRIHKAAQTHDTAVVLSNGEAYSLRYEMRDKSIAWEPYEVVFVQPVSGIVPCGWFRIKSLLAEV